MRRTTRAIAKWKSRILFSRRMNKKQERLSPERFQQWKDYYIPNSSGKLIEQYQLMAREYDLAWMILGAQPFLSINGLCKEIERRKNGQN